MKYLTGIEKNIYECPYCHNISGKVIDSRDNTEGKTKQRKRVCSACRATWETVELTSEEYQSLFAKSENAKLKELNELCENLTKTLVKATSISNTISRRATK